MSCDFPLSDFAELRRQVQTATDFDGFWSFYMTAFVERPGFLNLGEPVEIERAVDVLETTAGLIMGRPGPVTGRNVVLVELPGAGIIHGSGIFDGRLAAVVYVPETDVGMFAIWAAGGQIRFARFLLREERTLSATA